MGIVQHNNEDGSSIMVIAEQVYEIGEAVPRIRITRYHAISSVASIPDEGWPDTQQITIPPEMLRELGEMLTHYADKIMIEGDPK